MLLAYVRFVKNEGLAQELLFAKLLVNDSKGESIFQVVKQYFHDNAIPLSNIFAFASDGAPAMTGKYRGCVAFLKKEVPNIFTIHCVIHRQHLVAKDLSARLHTSLQTIITAVNKIKSHPLNDRIFQKLCVESDNDFEKLLFHTEVRWLFRGNCLKRFYDLFETVVKFFEDKDTVLCDELKRTKADAAYLSDLFGKFNEMNLQLQGCDINLIKTKTVVLTFISKLKMFQNNIGQKDFHQFSSLLALSEKAQDDDFLVYCNHLDVLHKNMQYRFEDLQLLEVPDWVINPFLDIRNAGELEEELIELQNDIELKPKFKHSYQEFWLQKNISVRYPALWAVVQKLLVAFPTSYLVEQGFSRVTQLLSKQRNRIKIAERRDLRLMSSDFTPDIDKLIKLHQPHISH